MTKQEKAKIMSILYMLKIVTRFEIMERLMSELSNNSRKRNITQMSDFEIPKGHTYSQVYSVLQGLILLQINAIHIS
jgi:hypothetical protein